MRELFHPRIMTSLIRATDYHKNAMNKLISRVIARCDIKTWVSSCASPLHELRQKALSSVGLTLLAHRTVYFHFGYVIN